MCIRDRDEVRQREERESRLRAEEEAQRRAEEEYRIKTEVEARQREEAEQRHRTEEESQRHVQEAYRRQSEAARLLDDERAFGLESQGEVEKSSAPEMVWGDVALPEAKPSAKAAEPTVSSQPMHVEDKGIEFVRAEKGIAPLGEDSDISAELVTRLNSDEPEERAGALADLARLGGDDAFRFIGKAFDDQSVDDRNAAARALYDLQPD